MQLFYSFPFTTCQVSWFAKTVMDYRISLIHFTCNCNIPWYQCCRYNLANIIWITIICLLSIKTHEKLIKVKIYFSFFLHFVKFFLHLTRASSICPENIFRSFSWMFIL
jgi:hypothetical protein